MPRFYPPDARVPDELRSDEFVLRMLRATDVELDYDAVISSREQLLLRSGGEWPREGFTLAENLADLQRHEADHLARTSFTYTVMNPTETECLGCVYINPLLPLLESLNASPAERATVRDDEAWVWFWVRQSRLADNLDVRLLAALRGWFADEWAFSRVLFHAIAAQTRPLRLYQMAGLAEQFVLQGKENVHFLYG